MILTGGCMQILTHQHTGSILMIGRNAGPLGPPVAWWEGSRAVRPKRLSASNFASGWILLIYVGKESQSAAISPEMPWQVNCILPLVTDSTFTITCMRIHTYTHARTHTHTHTHKDVYTLFLWDDKHFLIYSVKSVFPETGKFTESNRHCSWRADSVWLQRNCHANTLIHAVI